MLAFPNLRLVFYEKGYEQNKKYGTELDENWNRYELRFRQEMAVSVVQELLRYRDVAGLAMEVLNSKIRFLEKPTDSMTTRKRLYPTYQAWAELMKDIGKVKLTMQPQKKSLQKAVSYTHLNWSCSVQCNDDKFRYRIYER